MLQLKDLQHSCRICLTAESELHSLIKSVNPNETSLCQIIDFAIGVKVELDNEFPKLICTDCKLKAIIAFELKKKCQESDSVLQELSKVYEIKIEKDESFFEPDFNMEDSDGFTDDDFYFGDEKPDKKVNDGISHLLKGETATVPEEFPNASYCPMCGAPCKDEESLFQHTQQKHNQYVATTMREYTKKDSLDIVLSELKPKEFNLVIKPVIKKQKQPKKAVKFKMCGSFCPLCGGCYKSSKSLSDHLTNFHKNSMFRPKSRGLSDTLSKFSKGLEVKKIKPKLISCVICKVKVLTNKLREHFTDHKDDTVYNCTQCSKKFLDLALFEAHQCNVKINKNEKSPASNITAQNVDDNNLSETTFQTFLKDDNFLQPYICKRCGAVCVSEALLQSHVKYDHFTCHKCFKSFSTIKSTKRHIRTCKGIEVKLEFTEPQPKVYECDICKEIFDDKRQIALHMVRHEPPRIYTCEVCQREFNRKDNLRTHKRTHVPRVKIPARTELCRYCGLQVPYNNRTVHMRRHTGVRNFKCTHCDRSFITSTDLNRHMMVHTGERPFVCTICGKKFSRNTQLSVHSRVHTGDRPYQCPHCDRAFTQSNDLRLHIRRHTGEKPYVCNVCGEGFIQGTALKKHRLKSGHEEIEDEKR